MKEEESKFKARAIVGVIIIIGRMKRRKEERAKEANKQTKSQFAAAFYESKADYYFIYCILEELNEVWCGC